MKNKRWYRIHPAAVFFLLTGLVAVFSWVGNVYGWEGVQSLLSSEGIRWRLRHVQDDFLLSPFLGPVLLMCMGVGLCLHSGWWALVRALLRHSRRPTRKERRALVVSSVVGAVYALVMVVLAVGPWSVMRNISGTLEQSPLQEGMFFLLSLGLGNMAVVYAYIADCYNSERDIVHGMAYGFIRFSAPLVTLFFVSLFFTSLRYTGLQTCIGLDNTGFNALYAVCALWSLRS